MIAYIKILKMLNNAAIINIASNYVYMWPESKSQPCGLLSWHGVCSCIQDAESGIMWIEKDGGKSETGFQSASQYTTYTQIHNS